MPLAVLLDEARTAREAPIACRCVEPGFAGFIDELAEHRILTIAIVSGPEPDDRSPLPARIHGSLQGWQPRFSRRGRPPTGRRDSLQIWAITIYACQLS